MSAKREQVQDNNPKPVSGMSDNSSHTDGSQSTQGLEQQTPNWLAGETLLARRLTPSWQGCRSTTQQLGEWECKLKGKVKERGELGSC